MTRLRCAGMVVLVVALASACRHHEPDACERAVARLQRIEAARPAPAVSPASAGRGLNPLMTMSPGERTNLMLDECRHGKYASYDPVLRCAMDGASDDAAAACIDRIVHDIVHAPAPEPAPGSTPGAGPAPRPDRSRH